MVLGPWSMPQHTVAKVGRTDATIVTFWMAVQRVVRQLPRNFRDLPEVDLDHRTEPARRRSTRAHRH